MISFYDVIVTASNSQTTPILSTNVTVRINVDDENDNPPEFNASSYQGRVSENATVGTVVARVFAKDRDKVPVFSSTMFSKARGFQARSFQTWCFQTRRFQARCFRVV